MPSHPVKIVHRCLAMLLVAAAVSATAGAQESYVGGGRGGAVSGATGSGDCESCRSQMRPPWHSSAVAGYGQRLPTGHCMNGACGPSHAAPCRSCGPAACGPKPCGPCAPGICGVTGFCHAPGGAFGAHYPLPPCLPRLHAFLRDGTILSPQPLVVPKCHECGAVITMGF